MKTPSANDRFVRVTAYLTDETFGYEHWRAAQFCAPGASMERPAVLIICRDQADRAAVLTKLEQP